MIPPVKVFSGDECTGDSYLDFEPDQTLVQNVGRSFKAPPFYGLWVRRETDPYPTYSDA